MKKILGLAILLIVAVSLANAQHDLSVYRKVTYAGGSAELSYYPWYWYTGPVFIDARYNFDWEKTIGVFAGKILGSDAFSVAPTLGLLFGPEYKGLSPQVYLMGKGETYAFTLLNQYSRGLSGSSSYLYNWYEVYLLKPFDYLELGATEQTFYELVPGSDAQMDIGPGARLTIDRIYTKIWYAWSPTQTEISKLYLTIGVTF